MVYDKMKAKYKKKYTERMHFLILLNYLLSRFKWDGLPETFVQEDLENILIYNGTVGMVKANGGLYVFPGGYSGDFNGYRGTVYRGALSNIGDFEGIADKEIAVGWNNATRSPEFFMMQIASILTEVDISEHVNVIFSRFMKVPKVHNQKEKNALTQTIQNILDGKIDAFVSDDIMSTDARRLLGSDNSDDMFLELTDVQQQDKIQYLNQYHDNIYKRFWTLYGQSTQVTSKLAQMTDDEIHSNDNTNLVYLMQCLEKRKEFAEKCNSIFGTNISVSLSECFENERKENTIGGEDGENKIGETGSNSGSNADRLDNDN